VRRVLRKVYSECRSCHLVAIVVEGLRLGLPSYPDD
jgi:hypothetical protein